MKKITVIYAFMHSRMGFSNEVTVQAVNHEDALAIAQKEVAMAYGSKMLKRFTFKIKQP